MDSYKNLNLTRLRKLSDHINLTLSSKSQAKDTYQLQKIKSSFWKYFYEMISLLKDTGSVASRLAGVLGVRRLFGKLVTCFAVYHDHNTELPGNVCLLAIYQDISYYDFSYRCWSIPCHGRVLLGTSFSYSMGNQEIRNVSIWSDWLVMIISTHAL